VRDQAKKAEQLLALHHRPKLLLLPNIWDPIGAMTLESLGYPAVATASASVAYSLGYPDGEHIPFDLMLDRVGSVADAVQVPVTADLEGGYADDPNDTAANIRRALDRGIVGINLEDTERSRGELYKIEQQCERIRAIRRMAEQVGVPLVINARTDVYLRDRDSSAKEKLTHCIERLKAYRDAGADCLYPIPLGDLATLRKIHDAVQTPMNAFAGAGADSLLELERGGVRRVSFGPRLFRAVQGRLKAIVMGLQDYESYDAITDGAISGSEIDQILNQRTSS